jgi:hypothetical protein
VLKSLRRSRHSRLAVAYQGMSDNQFPKPWSTCRATWFFTTVIIFVTVFAAGVEADSLLIDARFINARGDPGNRPINASLTLGVIAGAIGGTPSRPLQVVRIAKSTIELDLDSFEAAAIKYAAPMTPAFTQSGLQIDPVDTRFARVSTGLKYSGSLPGDLRVGFIDPDSKNPLTLVYFDRACRLTGTRAMTNPGSDNLTLVYDVTVDKPGLHWIVRTPEGSMFVMRVATESIRKMLVVAPVENLKHGSLQIN